MIQDLVRTASQVLRDLHRIWLRERLPASSPRRPDPMPCRSFQPLECVVLTDGVGRTLFEEFAKHREADRGDEETGWVLLGLREEKQAIVLATLPAGGERDAGAAHVRFNSGGQVLGSRIVRQWDRRLTTLGVVHTHPGSLRHPSDGDLRGDSAWVGRLRGREGIFGIGTADEVIGKGVLFAQQPRPNVQCLGELCFSWYALADGDRSYRRIPVGMTIGPDLARSLHAIWPTIEANADRLDRLYRQQADLTFDVLADRQCPRLGMTIRLAEPGGAIRVLLDGTKAHYYVVGREQVFAVDPPDEQVDRSVYLLLAELARQG